jgi:hypothetical protein
MHQTTVAPTLLHRPYHTSLKIRLSALCAPPLSEDLGCQSPVATAAKANVAWNVDHSSCFFLCRGGRPQLGQSNQRSAHLGWSATVRVVGKNDSLPRRSDLYPESSSTPSDLLQERIHDALVLYPPADALTLPRALINCRDEYLTVEFMTVLITVLLLRYATLRYM